MAPDVIWNLQFCILCEVKVSCNEFNAIVRSKVPEDITKNHYIECVSNPLLGREQDADEEVR